MKNFLLIILITQILSDDHVFENINLDGLLLEVGEKDFLNIMKKVDYAVVYLFKNRESNILLEEFKIAAETFIKHTSAIGVFKINCRYDNEICENIMINNELPILTFIFYGN